MRRLFDYTLAPTSSPRPISDPSSLSLVRSQRFLTQLEEQVVQAGDAASSMDDALAILGRAADVQHLVFGLQQAPPIRPHRRRSPRPRPSGSPTASAGRPLRSGPRPGCSSCAAGSSTLGPLLRSVLPDCGTGRTASPWSRPYAGPKPCATRTGERRRSPTVW